MLLFFLKVLFYSQGSLVFRLNVTGVFPPPESSLSDIDEQMECIDEVHSSSEEELPEHLPSSLGQTTSMDQDMGKI